jgi:hypothetical protein
MRRVDEVEAKAVEFELFRADEERPKRLVPLDEVIRRSQLRALQGIGDAIARRIIELRDKGTDQGLEKLRVIPTPVD